jgi:flagellar M-ring protein FliF
VNETFSQYWSRAAQYWQQVSKTQKIMLFSIIGITIITIAILVFNFSKTEYALAYTDLSATDAAAIKTFLESEGVPYQFSPDGTSIGVPSKLVTDVKIDVASQNLVQNGSQGFGLFRDNISGFGMTDNEFGILSVDARAGEIQKLLNSYEGVSRSQVLLTIPEESVFINSGEPEESLASVVITFKPGYRPSQEMIDGIYVQVKTGVANLPLENITVTDQNGTLLSSSELSGGMAGASSVIEQQMKIKKMFEADIQKNIKSFLGTIYDSRRVAVSVVATLNFDQKHSDIRTFTPVNQEDGTGIVRSEQTEERSSSSQGGGGAGGVVGTGESEVPNYPGAANSAGSSESEESIATRNYEINEITQSIKSSPYIVQDLTIFAGIEPPDPTDPESLSQNQVDEIKRILTNVVSTSLANNNGQVFTQEELANKVSVLAQSFRGVPEPGTANESAIWYYALGGAALALIAAGGVYAVSRRRKREQLAALEAAAEDAKVPVQIEFPTIDMDQVGSDSQIRKQLEGLAKKKPEEFVNLLRTWLVDES